MGAQANNDFTNVSLTFGGLAGVSYGFTNEFTAGVSYNALVASKGDALGTGPLLANVLYSVYTYKTLEVLLMGSAGYSFDQKAAAPLTLGVLSPWNVLPWMTIGVNGDQFAFGVASPNDITFSMPLQVAFQILPWFWARINIDLFKMNVRSVDEDKALFTIDEVAAGPRVVFSPTNQWDLSAGASLNPVPPGQETVGGSLQWTAAVTYYGNVTAH